MTELIQSATYPSNLQDLVCRLKYKPEWEFHLYDDYNRGQGSHGMTLIITTWTSDTDNHNEWIHVNHLFPVPPAAYNDRSWTRWLFERCLDIEAHEAMEFFQIDNHKPFAPNHGPGHDPYQLRELNRLEDAETTFRGVRLEGTQVH